MQERIYRRAAFVKPNNNADQATTVPSTVKYFVLCAAEYQSRHHIPKHLAFASIGKIFCHPKNRSKKLLGHFD